MLRNACLRLLTLVFLCSAALFAQRDLATISGTVTDAQGSAVPNAKITITEDATGINYEVVSDSKGEFIRPLVKAGT